jgi:hypothetical protein
VVDGYVDPPRRPDLGIEIGHDYRNRETYDWDDGSIVDWQFPQARRGRHEIAASVRART